MKMTIDEIIKDVPDKYVYHREKAGVILCGDCLEIMPMMPDGCVDLIVTDPPYGLNYASNRPVAGNEKDLIEGDKLSDWHILMEQFLPLVFKKMESDSEGYIFCGGGSPIIAYMWTKLMLYFRVKNMLIWDKEFVGLGWDWRFQYETIFQVVKGKGCITPKNKEGGSDRANVLRCKNIIPQKGDHPTVKPVGIIRQILEAKLGNIILDPFLGSGTTAVACKELGRQFIGIEISEKYYQIAVERLRQEVFDFNSPTLQG